MYAAPPEVTADVFTEIPAAHRAAGRHSDWFFGKDDPNAHSFLEGPAVDRAGNLWVTDIPFGRLIRIAPDGTWSLSAEYDGEPNGLAFHRDGRAILADHRRGLVAVDTATGAATTLLGRVRREGFKGLNDLTFDSQGNLYFTDQGQTGLQDPTGRVWRMRAATGHLECLIDNVPSPNGLVLTKGDKALLLAVTRANQIWRLPLHADGSTSKVSIFIQLSGGLTGPDGLAIDEDDNLAIAHCGLGTVWLFSKLGEPMLRVRSPRGLSTTNICYGGADGRTLFVTESDTGTMLSARMPVPGRRLFSHAG